MSKTVNQYLKFYVNSPGAYCLHTDDHYKPTKHNIGGHLLDRWNDNCQLVLRPLRGITADEIKVLGKEILGEEPTDDVIEEILIELHSREDGEEYFNIENMTFKQCADATNCLVNFGFDLFGLIGQGLALNSDEID